jgi:hypothetical protein
MSEENVIACITIYFNNPFLAADPVNDSLDEGECIIAQDATLIVNYDLSLKIPTELANATTLASLRSQINKLLASHTSTNVEDIGPYHFKRNALSSTPQFKDETKTFFELDLVDQCILHLEVI